MPPPPICSLPLNGGYAWWERPVSAMIKVHTKIPKIANPEIPGVVCKNDKCAAGIGMASDLAALGKSFEAKCPNCARTATYRKSEIKPMKIEQTL